MFELLKKVKSGEAADRATTIARYRSILECGDAATEPQIAELRQLMSSLGYDSAKMEADAGAVANRKHLREVSGKEAESEHSTPIGGGFR